MAADALVRARIPQDTKERAVAALDKMGLSTSDVIRLVMMRVAEEGRLPFEVKTPNAADVTCRTDVNGDKVCSDGTKTRTNVWGDEVTTGK